MIIALLHLNLLIIIIFLFFSSFCLIIHTFLTILLLLLILFVVIEIFVSKKNKERKREAAQNLTKVYLKFIKSRLCLLLQNLHGLFHKEREGNSLKQIY